MRQSRSVRRLAILCMPLVAACQSLRPTASRGSDGGRASLVRVYDTHAARWVEFSEMTRAVSQADVIFFGEQHDDPVTHRAQLDVLRAIGERRGRVVLALEMFERDVQPLLDRYLAGAVAESAFLAGTRPWDRYATDYRPMVELARARGWPVVAANIPRRIASDVSRRGLPHLDTLALVERGYAAREHSCPRDRYFDRFTKSMGSHSAGGGPPAAADAAAARSITDRFYEAQCVKDEAMGEAVAAAHLRNRGTPVLHVDGAFHSDFGLGTVERTKRRVPDARVVVLTAVPVADPSAADVSDHTDRADYILFTRASPGR